MDFSEAFEAPITETIGGKEVKFPVLWCEDYLPWVSEVSSQRRNKSKTLIPPKADPIDQFRMARMAEFEEPSLDVIAEKVWTLPGAMKILHLSLEKSGIKDEGERKAVIRGVRPARIIPLAVEVSALFEKRPVVQQQPQGTTDPNSVSAEEQKPAG